MFLKTCMKYIKTTKNSSLFDRFSTPKYLEHNRKYCETNFKSDHEPTSVITIKRTLKNSGYDFVDGFSCINTSCPVCSENRLNKSIYINKTTGNIACPSCQLVSSWSALEKYFISSKSVKVNKELEKSRDHFVQTKPIVKTIELPEGARSITTLTRDELETLLSCFEITNISSVVLENLDVHCDPTTNTLFFFLRDVQGTIVGYRCLSKNNDQFIEETKPDINCFGLISTKTVTNPKITKDTSAILVLNILDFLALTTQKINSIIICLPHGVKSLPQECLPGLERYQKLILWFNFDTVGWDTARNFAKKLDEKRCLFVRPTDSHPSPYNALQQSLDFKAIITKAQPILHKAITTFSSLRQDVLSDLQNNDKVQGVKWRRYPQLNKLLKGHRKGELTILTGPTGCGKTTFMAEYSLDLAMQGVTTLWGSFEIRNTRLASTLLRQMAGHPLNDNLVDFDFWADEFERLPMYFMTFHGQQSIKIVMETIDHAQYVHDIQHVIIDNVQFMMGTSDESKHIDRFWRQDAIIASFRTFATKKNCHVTLVIHPRKERDDEDLTTSSIFGSAKATQEADNVLIIQDKRLTAIRGKKYLQVAKNRFSGDLGIMPLDFDKMGLSYAPKKKKPEEKPPLPAIPQSDILPS